MDCTELYRFDQDQQFDNYQQNFRLYRLYYVLQFIYSILFQIQRRNFWSKILVF